MNCIFIKMTKIWEVDLKSIDCNYAKGLLLSYFYNVEPPTELKCTNLYGKPYSIKQEGPYFKLLKFYYNLMIFSGFSHKHVWNVSSQFPPPSFW